MPSTTPGRWRTGPRPRRSSRSKRLATSAAAIGRGASINPTAAAASPISSAAVRPAARRSRTEVSPSAFESFEPSGRRMSGWWANAAGVSRPSRRASRIWVGVAASRSRPRITRSIALAKIVDDDREPVCPVPVAIADRQVAGTRGDLVRARPDDRIHPALRAATRAPTRRTGPSSPRCRQSPGQPGSVPQAAVLVRPGLERRARAVAAIDEDLAAEPFEGRRVRRVVVGLADRALVGDEPQPRQVLEQCGLVFRPAADPVVVLDAQEDPPVGRAARRPRPRSRSPRDRDAGTRSGPVRNGSALRAGTRRRQPASSAPPSRSEFARARSRSRASSARVATISRR